MEQSLQAAQQMLAMCSNVPPVAADRPLYAEPADANRLASSTRKCRSVQFGLVPRDHHRLRRISDQLGWSRAELARRCLLLVMEFLEERYPQLRNGDDVSLSESSFDVEQLSLWHGQEDPSLRVPTPSS